MTYKLSQELGRIVSPIVLRFSGEGRTMRFENGRALTAAEFEKKYLIESLEAEGDCVMLTVRENDRVNDITWADGEAPPGFF